MIIGLQHPITIEVQATITVKPASVEVVPDPADPAPDPVDPPADPDPVDPDPVDPDPIPDPVTPPTGGLALEYVGGFRIKDGTVGDSRPAYSDGVISVTDDGLWIAGHTHHRAIGKYELPTPAPTYDIGAMPIAQNASPFVRVEPEPWDENARVTGILEDGGRVITTVAQYYDANTDNEFDLAWVNSDGSQEGFFAIEGGAKAAGWVYRTPAEYVNAIGPYYMGNSSFLAINGRLSHGPSLYGWDGQQTTVPIMVFPMSHPMGTMGEEPAPANALWNELSFAATAFIHNGKYIAVGQTGGIRSGVGYKVRGNGGYASIEADDTYSYFWIFDMEDVLNASSAHEPRPEAYGLLDVPFIVDGASYHNGFLYLCSKDGDSLQSQYERNPVIYKYQVS